MDELVYASHPRGFALASMRNPSLSRYYIQVPLTDRAQGWSDDAFWAELRARLPQELAGRLVTGPSIEKSIAPLRSFVCEPMRWGRLFLCGDAAHIVPPTGAKGLNLAASDVRYLSEGLIARYQGEGDAGIEAYSDRALRRVWQAMRFSWSVTTMMHRFPKDGPFDLGIKSAELDLIQHSDAARRAFCEAYTGAFTEDA